MLPVIRLPVVGLLSSYAIIRTVYVFLALWLTLRLSERQGIARSVTLTVFALGVPAGILGAHVLDMIEYWGAHGGLADVLSPTGSSIYGAFLAVVPLVWLYARSQGVSFLRVVDAGAPAMALGETITRLGCVLNGCCYGIPWNSPLAVVFPRESFAYHDQIARRLLLPEASHSLPVVPVQLISAALALAAFIGLLRMVLGSHRDGTAFYAFLIFYGVLRLAMAPLRQEALQSMVVFSIAFIAIGVGGLVLGRREARAPAKPRPRMSVVR